MIHVKSVNLFGQFVGSLAENRLAAGFEIGIATA
jgi:hypothetical protein